MFSKMVSDFTKALRKVFGARMRRICHNKANSDNSATVKCCNNEEHLIISV